MDPDRSFIPSPPPDICTLPPEAGPCEAFIPSFFFNATSDRCERFIYGGCLGNDNRFSTVQECEERCGEFPQHPSDNISQ